MSDFLSNDERYPDNYKLLAADVKAAVIAALDYDVDFGGVSLCDVSAGYIQLNVMHAAEPSYVHYHTRLEYDFSNSEEAVEAAIGLWSTEKKLASAFYRDGEKYGWD